MRFFLSAICLFALSSFSQAGEEFVVEVTANKLNVRTGASTNHRILRTAKQGEQLTVYGTAEGWYRIDYPKALFVYSKYITADGSVNGSKINVRTAKIGDSRSEVICQLNNGDKVTVLATEGDWVRIKAPGKAFAYISSDKKFTKYIDTLASLSQKAKNAEQLIAILAEAEKRYQGELKKDDHKANYKRVIALYKKALPLAADPAQKSAIEGQLSRAQNLHAIADRLRKVEQDRVALQKTLEAKEQAYQKKVEELEAIKEEKAPTYLAVGWVESVGRYVGRPAAYRLVKGGRKLYFLKSSGYDLSEYAGKYVGVKGDVQEVVGETTQLLIVKRIDVLK